MLYFLLVQLLFFDSYTQAQSVNINKIEKDWNSYVIPDHLIDRAITLSNQYGPNNWEYNINCRLLFQKNNQFVHKSQCLHVPQALSCFQELVLYNHTWNTELPTFPQQLAVLQRFPRCWSKLGPLLCATLYRPCTFKKMYSKKLSKKAKYSSIVQTEHTTTDELWQVFYPDFCHDAVKECSFLENLQLWPSFLRCNEQVPSEMIPSVPNAAQSTDFKLFNSKCKVAYVQSPSQPKRYQCLWPLVEQKPEQAISTQPLVDECYMPCRSPLIGSQTSFDYFYGFAAVLCVVLFSIYVYLTWLSQAYIDHFEVFLVANALLCSACYFFLLFLPWFDLIFEASICTKQGKIRDEIGRIGFGSLQGLQNLFHLCTLQGGLLLFSFISSFVWAVAYLLIHLLFGSKSSVADYKIRLCVLQNISDKPNSPTHSSSSTTPAAAISSRTLISVFINLLTAMYTVIVLLLSQVPVEARLGSCHFGVGNTHKPLFLYVPAIAVLLVVILVFVARTAVSVRAPKESQQVTHLEVVTSNKLSLLEENKNIVKMNGIETARKDHLSSSGNKNYVPSLFSSTFFGLLLVFASVSISANFAIYFLWQIQAKNEKEIVLESIFCSLQTTILGTNSTLEWMEHSSWREDMLLTTSNTANLFSRMQSLQKYISAPNCSLPVQEDKLYLFTSLLFLPSLPFLLISLWFFGGLFKSVSHSKQLLKIRADILRCKKKSASMALYSSQSDSKSSLPRNNESPETDTRLLLEQPTPQSARPRKHCRQPPSSSSSVCSTTSNMRPCMMPRMALSNGNINHGVLKNNDSELPSVRSDPTNSASHLRRLDMSQRLKKYKAARHKVVKNGIFALVNGNYSNKLSSDGASLNSNGTFNFTSVSGQRTVYDTIQPTLLDTVHALGMQQGMLVQRQHQMFLEQHSMELQRFRELNTMLAKDLQKCRHSNGTGARVSARKDPSNGVQEDDGSEEDMQDLEDEEEELLDEEEQEDYEDTSTLRNTTDGSTESFNFDDDEPVPEEEAHIQKYLARLEELKKNAREPLPWQILATTSNNVSDKTTGDALQ